MNGTLMKKTAKKSSPKAARRKREDRPIEFKNEWAELEAQHDRANVDWMGLAAQIGMADLKEP
jgi:hypothetical protein